MEIEISEISFSNAIVDPWTMMIKSLNALVAHVTMSGPARHYDFTVRAKSIQLECFHQPHKLLIPRPDFNLCPSWQLLICLLNGP